MRNPFSLARRNRRRGDRRSPLSSALLVVVLASTVSPAVAQNVLDQSAPLAKLVPADVGLFVEFHGLAVRLQRFRQNPQFARISKFPPWQNWNKNHGKDLSRIGRQIAQHLGVEASDVWDKVLGEALAVAV